MATTTPPDRRASRSHVATPLAVGWALVVGAGALALWVWDDVSLWTQIALVLFATAGALLLLVTGLLLLLASIRFRTRDGDGGQLEPAPLGGGVEGSAFSSRGRSDHTPRMLIWAPLGLAALTLGFVGAIVLLNAANVSLPEFVLPILLVGGVVALLMTIAIVAVVFSHRELSDPNAALGLPEGSVRAVIALCLILIFAIMALFLYATLLKGDVRSSRRLTLADINQLPEDTQVVAVSRADDTDPVTGAALFNVELSVPANEASQDFANQVLTTVSTLVVAISAFYFGAKTGGATERGERPGPGTVRPPTLRVVSPPSPTVRPSTGTPLPILVETTPAGLDVRGEIVSGDASSGRLSNMPEPGKWEYVPSSSAEPVVILRFWLADTPEVEQRLEVKAPPGG
jgi:hypothetical protein